VSVVSGWIAEFIEECLVVVLLAYILVMTQTEVNEEINVS
jgi:hypothetical protein